MGYALSYSVTHSSVSPLVLTLELPLLLRGNELSWQWHACLQRRDSECSTRYIACLNSIYSWTALKYLSKNVLLEVICCYFLSQIGSGDLLLFPEPDWFTTSSIQPEVSSAASHHVCLCAVQGSECMSVKCCSQNLPSTFSGEKLVVYIYDILQSKGAFKKQRVDCNAINMLDNDRNMRFLLTWLHRNTTL